MSGPVRLESRCGECLLYGAIEGMADALVLVDREGKIFHLNRRAEELLDVTMSSVLGAPIRKCLQHRGLAAFWSSASRDSTPVTTDLTFSRGITIRATVSACQSQSGEPIGTVLLLRDITREKKIQVELTSSVARRIIDLAGGDGADDELPPLTRREREILRLLAGGLSNASIASRLHVTVNTVASHLKHLYPKIGVNNRSRAAASALSHGLRPPKD